MKGGGYWNSGRAGLLSWGFALRRGQYLPLRMALICWLIALPCISLGADLVDAVALYKRGAYAECAKVAGEAIEAGQFSETWRTLKLEAELAQGDHEAALVTLDQALEKFRTSVRLRWLGARVCRYVGQLARAQAMLAEIDTMAAGYSWRYSDPASRIVLGRYYLERGADPKQVLEGIFGWVKRRQASYTDAYLAAGQLALSKHDYGLAQEEFEAALRLDTTDPEVHFGLARAAAKRDAAATQRHLETALERNPHHLETLLFLADHAVDAEREAAASNWLRQALAVNPREPRAWSLLAVMAHLENDPVAEFVCRETALAAWPSNPEVDHLLGSKLSQKYRFAEGAAYQRRALERDADYAPARFQLAQDLLRLGQEEEGLALAQEVFRTDAYNVVAHNLVQLQQQLERFVTLNSEHFVVRMERREAELYGSRVVDLLERAYAELGTKYDVSLDQRVLVEIFPKQADFAIRTFGLPGGDGFLGVCFGRVITANSPASRSQSPANWEAVLWHEFCHVVTLEKTRNKMPRWLSEGISVYEERQATSTWGQTMIPAYRAFILSDQMPPVSQLSASFLEPPSPLHLQFAYYQSSLVVQFLIEKHGLEVLKRVLVDLGVGMPIEESLARYTGSPENLDREFAEYARRLAEQLAPEAEWDSAMPDEVPPASRWGEWVREHPRDFIGLLRVGQLLLEADRLEEARVTLERAVEIYPQHHESGGAYWLL